jgi:hypothetical protein
MITGLYEEFDHVPTGIHIPIDTLLLIFTFIVDNHCLFLKRVLKTQRKCLILILSVITCLCCDVAECDLCWPRIGSYEVIETHCSSQCYVVENICECKYLRRSIKICFGIWWKQNLDWKKCKKCFCFLPMGYPNLVASEAGNRS